MQGKVVVVCGPTASGKTALGVALALRCGGEVVSADSMQVYRRMDIGTAKPTAEERRGVAHHMLDVAEPDEPFSAGRYVCEAAACVDRLLADGKLPVIVGGTGLYIDSLVAGRTFPAFSGRLRAQLQARAQTEGISSLHRELCAVDPERAAVLHLSDEKRIIRALEVWHETGETITAHDRADAARPPRYDALYLGLGFRDRAILNARTNRRVDEMRAAGLEGEVSALLAAGVPSTATSMQAIGYRQFANGLTGDAVFDEIKLCTRRYAKRQMTWFGRNPAIRWHLQDDTSSFDAAVRHSTKCMEEFGI